MSTVACIILSLFTVDCEPWESAFDSSAIIQVTYRINIAATVRTWTHALEGFLHSLIIVLWFEVVLAAPNSNLWSFTGIRWCVNKNWKGRWAKWLVDGYFFTAVIYTHTYAFSSVFKLNVLISTELMLRFSAIQNIRVRSNSYPSMWPERLISCLWWWHQDREGSYTLLLWQKPRSGVMALPSVPTCVPIARHGLL